MRHEFIWEAVDNLAKRNGLSPSGMAKLVGLDPTTFNKSKRLRADGKKRWPSLLSINKLLMFFDITFDDFCGNTAFEAFSSLPMAQYSSLNLAVEFENNEVSVKNWEFLGTESLKNIGFALLIDTKRFEPIYKHDSVVIVSKDSEVRRGDRVLVINRFKEIGLYEFVAKKVTTVELIALNKNSNKEELKNDDIFVMKRILWASQ